MVETVNLITIGVFSLGSFVLGVVFTLKAVKLGLKWKLQAENNLIPTTTAEDKPAVSANPLFSPDLMHEYLTGEVKKPKKDDEE